MLQRAGSGIHVRTLYITRRHLQHVTTINSISWRTIKGGENVSANAMSKYKRKYYMEQLKHLGINEINSKQLHMATERELKFKLIIERVKVN